MLSLDEQGQTCYNTDILQLKGGSMGFKKLETKKKAEYVVEQILEVIKEGMCKIGDKLPSENEITEMTGVSRPAVREALGALRLVGVIETKAGDGTYVKSVEVQPQISLMLEQGDNPFEALEARRIVEPAAAQLALARLNEEKIRRIRKGFQQMQEAAKKRDMESFHIANKEFHGGIVQATENSSLTNYVSVLLNLFTNSHLGLELKRQYLTDESYVKKSLETHGAILENLLNSDGMKLEEAYVEHFNQLEEQLLGIEGGDLNEEKGDT